MFSFRLAENDQAQAGYVDENRQEEDEEVHSSPERPIWKTVGEYLECARSSVDESRVV